MENYSSGDRNPFNQATHQKLHKMTKKPANANEPAIYWPKLLKGILLKRYKRFIADVRLANGRIVQVHCPNSGSMKACNEPGSYVHLSRASNPKRRLKYTWELIETPGSMVGINTNVPNRLVETSVLCGAIPELIGYDSVRREVKYGENSRIDLLLESVQDGKCFVEVKNCTLVEKNIASFPDAVTSRGLKHVHELCAQISAGNRAVVLFLVQRMDAVLFRPADHIDPAFGIGLREAVMEGLEVLVYDVDINTDRIKLRWKLPVEM